ncbi:MAG: hypothetical protein HGB09_01430 [Chlorobiaceae bacterium]|nr:hypothetical protein [Chlorobiaceae bacterium]
MTAKHKNTDNAKPYDQNFSGIKKPDPVTITAIPQHSPAAKSQMSLLKNSISSSALDELSMEIGKIVNQRQEIEAAQC